MLLEYRNLNSFTLHASDGHVGKVSDVYFDDITWLVRYVIVDNGKWLPGRLVLISPTSIDRIDPDQKEMYVNLTCQQVEESPPVYKDRPVGRQKELELADYFAWPTYWAPIAAPLPGAVPPDGQPAADTQREPRKGDPNLRSAHEVKGYYVEGLDGEIGHMEDFILNDTSWMIRYVVIDTKNRWPGRKVILSPDWISHINWEARHVFFDLDRVTIQNAPGYKREHELTHEDEIKLYGYYLADFIQKHRKARQSS